MPQPLAKPFSGIFVSYRRDDSSGHAGRLFDKLVSHFGKDRIFMDIDTIEPGEDFVAVIENAVGSCDILIAIIGRNWLSGTGGTTGRLDNPNDFVRLEIATALSRDIRVIPVLVQRASMPKPQDLPDDLAKFARRNAVELSDLRWHDDVDQLISVMEKVLVKREEAVRLAEAARQAEEERQRREEQEKPTSTQPQPRAGPAAQGIEFILIPPGSFMMGSTNGKVDEKPAHEVTINYSFYMGKYEVTQAQWQSVMGSNPSNFKDCGNCPVELVSWNDAQDFINKLNTPNDGFKYRLPSEAEWEYACRAGTTGDYAGNLSEMAWYSENSGNKTHAVGGKRPNDWGLADMHGNVWEWCQDWYHETYYGAPTDGSAWLSGGEQKYRVPRGGSWVSVASLLRSANRLYYTPDNRYNNIGFRLVAVVRTS